MYSRLRVNGTWVRHAYWLLRTPRTGKLIHVTFHSGKPRELVVSGQIDRFDVAEGGRFSLEGISISLRHKTATVQTRGWKMDATSTVGYPHWQLLK